MFIVVAGKEHRMREIPAYLYEGQSVVVQPVETLYGTFMAVVDTGSANAYRASYVRDRIASGMFGAILFETLEEAEQYIEGSKTF
jgi:hypothetical protein